MMSGAIDFTRCESSAAARAAVRRVGVEARGEKGAARRAGGAPWGGLSLLTSAVLAWIAGGCARPRVEPPPAASSPDGRTAAASRCEAIARAVEKTPSYACGDEAACVARCDGGSAHDCCELGGCYGTRTFAPEPDLARFVRYSARGCELGDPSACTNLGDAYAKGYGGVPADRARAEALFARALAGHRAGCSAGDGDACYMVSHAYRQGQGVAADAAEARAFEARACALGKPFSCAALVVDATEAGRAEEAIAYFARVCELTCWCDEVRAARVRGAPAAARALDQWKARCDRGDVVACDAVKQVETAPPARPSTPRSPAD